MEKNKLYRMHEKWIHQSWYDSNSVFQLVKITENRMQHFGVDCMWKNVETGLILNQWDRTMRELTKEECREFNLSIVLN